jgi:methyl-accepting chemotaxis protein
MVTRTEEYKALKSAKRKKMLRLTGMISLVVYMLISLVMLSSLKALDSKLGENSRLLGQAIEKQYSMGEKGANIQKMSDEFAGILGGLGEVGDKAGNIGSLAGQIKAINNQLLSVDQALDGITLNNLTMVGEVTTNMSTIVDYMGQVGGMLSSVSSAAASMLETAKAMYELAVKNNASMPPLP